jgi:hypothetical protein
LESIDKQKISTENLELDASEPEVDFTCHNFYDSDFDDEPAYKKKKKEDDHSSDDDWKPESDSESDSYSSCDSCDDDEIIEFTGWDDEEPLTSANEPKE